MDLDDIKRGLRAEIKKRENEQYLTFQCNVRQMCKDVLAKLEEQESEIAELKEHNENYRFDNKNMLRKITKRDAELRRQKYKRCLDKAEMCQARYDEEDAKVNGHYSSWEYISPEMKYWERWRWRWDALADKFKPNSTLQQKD